MKKHPLFAFLILVSVFSAGFIIAIKLTGEKGYYLAAPYMLVPAIAAVITRIFFYEKRFKDARLRFGKWTDYLKFYIITLVIVVFSFLIFASLGAISFDFSGETFLKQLEEQMALSGKSIDDLPAGFTPKIMMTIYFIGGLTLFNIPLIIMGFGEEFGWRGLMFPLLCKRNLITGFIIGGLIWFAWHVPLVFIMPDTTDFTLWQNIINFIALAIGSICSFIFFAYAFARSGSIWVASLAHIVFNNSSRSFSQYVVIEDQLLANLGLMITMVIVVGILYLRKELNVFRNFLSDYHSDTVL